MSGIYPNGKGEILENVIEAICEALRKNGTKEVDEFLKETLKRHEECRTKPIPKSHTPSPEEELLNKLLKS